MKNVTDPQKGPPIYYTAFGKGLYVYQNLLYQEGPPV